MAGFQNELLRAKNAGLASNFVEAHLMYDEKKLSRRKYSFLRTFFLNINGKLPFYALCGPEGSLKF